MEKMRQPPDREGPKREIIKLAQRLGSRSKLERPPARIPAGGVSAIHTVMVKLYSLVFQWPKTL